MHNARRERIVGLACTMLRVPPDGVAALLSDGTTAVSLVPGIDNARAIVIASAGGVVPPSTLCTEGWNSSRTGGLRKLWLGGVETRVTRVAYGVAITVPLLVWSRFVRCIAGGSEGYI